VEFADGADEVKLVSDDALLGSLIQQVLRACRYHLPDAAVRLRVALRPEAAAPAVMESTTTLILSYELTRAPASAPAVARTGLVLPEDEPQDRLARLIEFTVSRELAEQLDVALLIGAADDSPALARLVIPLLPAELSEPVPPPAVCA
jgi:hypothetical protein